MEQQKQHQSAIGAIAAPNTDKRGEQKHESQYSPRFIVLHVAATDEQIETTPAFPFSVKVSLWQRSKQYRQRNGDEHAPDKRLQGDLVLHQPHTFILHPHCLVKDFPDHHLRTILLDPDSRTVRIGGSECFESDLSFLCAAELRHAKSV